MKLRQYFPNIGDHKSLLLTTVIYHKSLRYNTPQFKPNHHIHPTKIALLKNTHFTQDHSGPLRTTTTWTGSKFLLKIFEVHIRKLDGNVGPPGVVGVTSGVGVVISGSGAFAMQRKRIRAKTVCAA